MALLSTIVVSLCYYHGKTESAATLGIIDEMTARGNLHGLFWRVRETTPHALVLEKYGHTISLAYDASVLPESKSAKGKYVSFRAERAGPGRGDTVWQATHIRFHGSSTLKFSISAIALAISGLLLFKTFRYDWRRHCLVPKTQQENPHA